ncbi:MAG: ROK family protein [Trueperaceae bacterium]|nr:ROK family protein [Trueperaceae bacterium]
MHHLGIDIGGSSVKLALLDAAPSVRWTRVHDVADQPDPDRNRRERLQLIAAAIGELRDAGAVPSVGIATPGIVDAAHRAVVSLPGKLAGLEGIDWTAALRDALPAGTDAPRVHALNDAHAAVLGEARLGAGRGARDIAMLTLGTGVGGGVMLNGQLFEGRNRRAGHLGHISLDPDGPPSVFPTPGTLEWHLGAAYLADRTGGRYASNEALLADVRTGQPAATAEWGRMVRALAAGIASIVNVFDPERVILGGGLAAAGDVLFAPLTTELDEVEWRPGGLAVPVVPAELGRHSGSIGAALFGRERSEA